MQVRTILSLLILLVSNFINAQGIDSSTMLQSVTVQASMATERMPLTFSTLKRSDIALRNNAQDVPYILKYLPSVVETSDAGTGTGYTGLRIRGTDASRINVCLDGVPLNDAESQSVYWVDVPDFASSSSTIQVQRGVGTSSNGAGAFGATINLITSPNTEKQGAIQTVVGSFGTFKQNVTLSSGLLNNHWLFDGRISSIHSNGYVDRGRADMNSYFASVHYLDKKNVFALRAFGGNEKTYQSWYGIPESYLNDDVLRRYNPAGTESTTPYTNQIDNYFQQHLHLGWSHTFNAQWFSKITAHYTYGAGYYEEYKADQQISNYVPKVNDTLYSDVVRRLWLQNHFYGAIYELHYKTSDIENIIGGSTNDYIGKSFGRVANITKNTPFDPNANYYESNANKFETNVYDKILWSPKNSALSFYVDAQFRFINYSIAGIDRNKRDVTNALTYNFFNPKIGMTYAVNSGSTIYASYATVNREPNRGDITDNTLQTLPQSEQLHDFELGWRSKNAIVQTTVNGFFMYYKNQLVLTGKLNDVGDALHQNVPNSYRMGIELEQNWNLSDKISLNSSISVMQHKIASFKEFITNYETGDVDSVSHTNTSIALSPNFIGSIEAKFKINDNNKFESDVRWGNKYVGKQYLDNTSNENTILNAYYTSDVHFDALLKLKRHKFSFTLSVLNLFDAKYANNGYASRYGGSENNISFTNDPYSKYEGNNRYSYSGYYAQAGRHWQLSAKWGF